ncbi:MAG: peptidylprolyl isomerase [Methylococcaceae bacterium]|nr:peptidylprolyl isomerase [Methylococcaceae bacterium]
MGKEKGEKMFNKVLFIIFCIINTANAALVEDNAKHKIESRNLEVYLGMDKAPAKNLKVFLKNKPGVKKQLKNLYLIKVMAKQAKDEGLLKDEKDKLKLQEIIDKFYYSLKLKQIAENNLPDFDPLARVYYNAHKKDYKVEERVDVSHIILSVKDKKEAEVLESIKKIRSEINNKSNFNALADKYSEDPSVKDNHGELGKFARTQLVSEFAEEAFKLKKGEVSQPVKTKFGYHLIKLNKRYPAGIKSFEEVKPSIIVNIKKDYLLNRRDEYFEKVTKDNKMEFNEKEIDLFLEKKLKEMEVSGKK